jgi:pyridoxine kinase
MKRPSAAGEPARPSVIVISSHVACGSVGNRAAVFALETLGFRVWAIPTVLLPYHPGHGPATRIEPEPGKYAALLNDLLFSPWIEEVGAVLTGYLASAEQVHHTAGFVRQLKAHKPGIRYLCDPVIGDVNGLYVHEKTAKALRDALLPLADIITPNIGELAWLCGKDMPDSIAGIHHMACTLTQDTIVATSAPALMRGNIANLLVENETAHIAENRLVDGPPNGAGDLFSALFLANILNGQKSVKALEMATSSVFEIIARAARNGDRALRLECGTGSIIRPMAMVSLRTMPLIKVPSTDKSNTAKPRL